MTSEEAIALLRRGGRTHFDPFVVDQFIKNLPHFERQIAIRGLRPQEGPEWLEPLKMFEVDIAQSRERGCYVAYDQIKNAHVEGYALYEIAQTFGSSCKSTLPWPAWWKRWATWSHWTLAPSIFMTS